LLQQYFAHWDGVTRSEAEGAQREYIDQVVGGRGVAGLLYGVTVWDPVIVASSTAVMLVTCLAAAVGPALRVRENGAVESLRA
jgi:hypothetical protein